jgi:hypothetical protein
MNTNALVEIQARLHRLERQNRILIMLLCAIAGVASIAATNHAGSDLLLKSHARALADGVSSYGTRRGALAQDKEILASNS